MLSHSPIPPPLPPSKKNEEKGRKRRNAMTIKRIKTETKESSFISLLNHNPLYPKARELSQTIKQSKANIRTQKRLTQKQYNEMINMLEQEHLQK